MSYIEPHSYTDLSQGKLVKVDLRLTVDFEKLCLHGYVILTLSQSSKGYIDLDTRDLKIKRVTNTEGDSLKWFLADPDPILGSRLRIELPQKPEAISISYETSPKSSALQWLKPENTAGRNYPYLFSQCQPHHARSILPIQDSAMVRFPYKAEITVKEPLVAVMSSAPGKKKKGPKTGLVTYSFEMPQPIPAYLLAIAVGNIAHRDLSPRSRVYAEPEMIEKAAWEFEPVESILLKAEELFGPYLWDRYDFIVMPPAFPYGGMENPRLNFFTPTIISGDRSQINTLAHELTHSWTGNLVTNATMNDFWLNEGFSVWAERRLIEVLEGKESAILAAAIGRNNLQKDIDKFGKHSPLTKLKTDLLGVNPDEVFSRIPYEKGFLFILLLEKTIGRGTFDNFLKEYIERFKFTSITTEQFLEFLDEKLHGLSEKVGALEWIYDTGIPNNCPKLESKRLSELLKLAHAWKYGIRPDLQSVHLRKPREFLVYLSSLPEILSYEDCEWLDGNFDLSRSGNADILVEWLVRAASSGYKPAFPKIRDFLSSVGRMKYLKPLYKALVGRDDTKEFALEMFDQYNQRYHPIAQSTLKRVLEAQTLTLSTG